MKCGVMSSDQLFEGSGPTSTRHQLLPRTSVHLFLLGLSTKTSMARSSYALVMLALLVVIAQAEYEQCVYEGACVPQEGTLLRVPRARYWLTR